MSNANTRPCQYLDRASVEAAFAVCTVVFGAETEAEASEVLRRGPTAHELRCYAERARERVRAAQARNAARARRAARAVKTIGPRAMTRRTPRRARTTRTRAASKATADPDPEPPRPRDGAAIGGAS